MVARAVNVERESEAARRTQSAATYTHYGTNSFSLEVRAITVSLERERLLQFIDSDIQNED